MSLPEKLRLFVAVALSQEVHQRVVRRLSQLKKSAPRAKFVRENGLHLTLAFLGYVDAGQVRDISLALEQAAATVAPFTLNIRGGGAFGVKRSPRVLWMGVSGDTEAMVRLQRAVATQLAPLGFPPEQRPYSPHLTLARASGVKGDPNFLRCVELLQDAEEGSFQVEHLDLMRSQLSPSGAQYSAVSTFALHLTHGAC